VEASTKKDLIKILLNSLQLRKKTMKISFDNKMMRSACATLAFATPLLFVTFFTTGTANATTCAVNDCTTGEFLSRLVCCQDLGVGKCRIFKKWSCPDFRRIDPKYKYEYESQPINTTCDGVSLCEPV
jgi:hypothetical protein